MGFEKPMKKESSEQENELGLTSEEQAFMDRADMTAAEMAQYKRWKQLEEELGTDQAA